MPFFDDGGRRIPEKGARVFGSTPSFYYKIRQPEIDYQLILDRSKQFNSVPAAITHSDFKLKAEALLDQVMSSAAYGSLAKGVKVPLIFARKTRGSDLGEELENSLLPALKGSFNSLFPESHFKAILQSNSELPNNITLALESRYEELILAAEAGPVVGWYFPQSLQEFDIRSQQRQMASLPDIKWGGVCLSGGIDICAAVSGVPDLLICDEFYAPILCMSAYVHRDPRLVFLLKAYGPHMEFWCMTQMLTSEIKQVSEQWAGGLTIFAPLNYK